MISLASSNRERVRVFLGSHQKVSRVEPGDALLAWEGRSLSVGNTNLETFGLPELVDNNPLVCASQASIPNPAQTLALIALGPLAEAGIIADTPRLIFSFHTEESPIESALRRIGWTGNVDVHVEPIDLGTAVAATIMVEVKTPDDPSELQDLFEERYSRSLYVRRKQDGNWDHAEVIDQPFALYRFNILLEYPISLLTIRVIADRDGKCGSAQAVHMFNIMCGFEESLGL